MQPRDTVAPFCTPRFICSTCYIVMVLRNLFAAGINGCCDLSTVAAWQDLLVYGKADGLVQKPGN